MGNQHTANQDNQGDFSCGLARVETDSLSPSQIVVRELAAIAAVVFAILFCFYFVLGQVLSHRCAKVHGTQNSEWGRCIEVSLKGAPRD